MLDHLSSSAYANPMDEKKNEAAVQLGRLGGIKGGRARANKLSNEQRTDIARGAAEARWGSRSILKPTHLGTLGIDREPQRASAAPRAMSVRCSLGLSVDPEANPSWYAWVHPEGN